MEAQSAERMAELVRGAVSVVALTGAGVSTASGIPDFRSPGTGLWETVDPGEVASIDAFFRDPVRFWSFYSHRFLSLGDAQPNPAHHALARMEALGQLGGLVTQNIDCLHQRAGSRRVAEVHGSIESARCLACGTEYPREHVLRLLGSPAGLPLCACGSVLKPGVVLFGEDLPEADFGRAVEWARSADLMLVAGTSLEVWPVAGLPEVVLEGGGRLVIVNAMPTGYDAEAELVVRGPVEQVLPELVTLLEDGARGV